MKVKKVHILVDEYKIAGREDCFDYEIIGVFETEQEAIEWMNQNRPEAKIITKNVAPNPREVMVTIWEEKICVGNRPFPVCRYTKIRKPLMEIDENHKFVFESADNKHVVFPNIIELYTTSPELYNALSKLYGHFGADIDGDSIPYYRMVDILCKNVGKENFNA